MKVNEVLSRLPQSVGAVVILSGGMDSTIAMRLAVEAYRPENVHAISFFYGQRQAVELERAAQSTKKLGVTHKIMNLEVLGEISQGVSANVDRDMEMPTIHDVLGDPAPKTEVPYRNMILLSLASAYAQAHKLPTIICGLQVHDLYSYWDCSKHFIDSMNTVIQQNRMFKPTIIAPFSDLTKTLEIKILSELDGNVNLLEHTLTCYNPNEESKSCGVCGACAERKKAFKNVGIKDPVTYV